MANTIDWGKATQNNTNGFGKYQNTINAGDIYADSWAGETAIVGTSAAFSYSKSSYHQGEADPTPTITGTTGGSFVCTSGALFVDTGSTSSSTGQIDLDASTIDTHLISYTVDGVTATANVGVTASPFLANTYSMQFDGTNYITTGTTLTNLSVSTSFSVSCWVKISTNTNYYHIVGGSTSYAAWNTGFGLYTNGTGIRFWVDQWNGANQYVETASLSTGQWYHITATFDTTNGLKLYVNAGTPTTATGTSIDGLTNSIYFGSTGTNTTYAYIGFLDEVAVWNTALSSDAITDIYNATNNNSGKALDLSTDSGNYSSSSNLQYFNRMGD